MATTFTPDICPTNTCTIRMHLFGATWPCTSPGPIALYWDSYVPVHSLRKEYDRAVYRCECMMTEDQITGFNVIIGEDW
jgi:hypothetical protein